jgi:hypothetical protein
MLSISENRVYCLSELLNPNWTSLIIDYRKKEKDVLRSSF